MTKRARFCILVLLPILLQGARSGYADVKRESIKIYTWQGLGTGYSSDVNQNLLKTNRYDSSDVDWYQSSSSIDKMKDADVVYVENHGGKVTSHPIPLIFNFDEDYPLENLGFPKSGNKGPSLILNWGCQNGNDRYVKKDGTVVNLMERYAGGLGIPCNSKTKVYIAPKINVGAYEGTQFQETFFKEFSKGNVTVNQAVTAAYAQWAKGQVGGSTTLAQSDFIGVCGNGNLTLDQLRLNVAERNFKPDKSIALVFDGSGSMNGKKIEFFKRYGCSQVEALNEATELALIMFNGCGSIHVLFEIADMTPENKKTVIEALKAISPSGDTNLAEGTDFGWKYLSENARSEHHSMILLSDGMETCNGDPVKAAGNVK